MLNDRVGWVGWNLVEKANHSKYEPKVHNMLNMLEVAIHANICTIMIDATLSFKMDIKWHETWVIAQVCIII